MERREALKGLGLSLGYTVATPSLIGLLQSCTTKAKWTPKYLSSNVAIVLENLVDLVLPKTEASPGALEVNVPAFIDLYYGKAFNEERQSEFNDGMKAIMNELQVTDTNLVSNLKANDYDKLLAKYLRTTKAEQEVFIEGDNLTFMALVDLRNTTVWAYRKSEEIGKNVMAYDPIPGVQLGCIPLEEATGGKRWSL